MKDLSFPGLANISYIKFLAVLAAFPAAVIILNVLSQLVRALPYSSWWDLSDLPPSFYLETRLSLRLYSIGYPS